MRKPRFNLYWSLAVIIFLGLLLVFICLMRILRDLDYFTIKEIISQNQTIDLSYLKDKNIFSINLQKESIYLSQQNPAYRQIRLVRIFPNRIFVDFIKRKPLAIIKLYRDFSVDEAGVILDVPWELDYAALPIILGLETKMFAPKSGRIYALGELVLALNIIRQIQGNRALKDYRLKIINVATLSNASFLLLPKNQATPAEGLEVRLGADKIKEKFSILTGLFTQDKNSLADVKYIDLRFKEPVIKLKNAK